ncbi:MULTISPECIES: hypothetical protein [Amycolatopsis]|uniref:Lipoprotein n=1 Tax=Amycolatopsis albidoflavus TaxID=102226 RepID=A0ABW5HT97_9PSEU
MWRLTMSMTAAALCCAGCGAAALAPAASDPSSATSPSGAGPNSIVVSPVPAAPPPMPSTFQTGPAESAGPVPAGADVFASPTAVAEAWMREWCAFDWREPLNGNLERAARFETAAAARADRTRGDNTRSYGAARAQQVSSTCGAVSATLNPEAPHSPDSAYLVVSARRTDFAAGVPFETSTLQSVREAVRQADGRWLVGDQVEAG